MTPRFYGFRRLIFQTFIKALQNGQTQSNNSSAVADELFEYGWPFCGIGTLRVKIKSNIDIKNFKPNSTKFFETFKIPKFENNYLVISKAIIKFTKTRKKGLLIVYLNNYLLTT